MLTDDFHAHVDGLLLEGNLGLALAPKLGPDDSLNGDLAKPPPDDGAFQVALRPWQKAAVFGGMRASGADKGFDRTVGAMTNGAFGPQEIHDLENRVLDKASWDDVKALRGINEGPPVYFTPSQKSVVDGLMRRLGDDPLAQRARAAYGRAMDAGQVRTR